MNTVSAKVRLQRYFISLRAPYVQGVTQVQNTLKLGNKSVTRSNPKKAERDERGRVNFNKGRPMVNGRNKH